MSTLPTADLELRAQDQRRRLQISLNELRDRMKDTLDVKRTVQRHVLAASGIAGALSLILGYGIAGFWTRN
jgi:hypothetical protein